MSINLDQLAAVHAQALVREVNRGAVKASSSEIDNSVTKALGVLQENSVYACMLYLASRTNKSEKEIAKVVTHAILQLLRELDQHFGYGWRQVDEHKTEEVLQFVAEDVVADLNRLLLVKETLEQMLIYARYGAKALPK